MTWYRSFVSLVHGCSRGLQHIEIPLTVLKNTQSSVPACDQSSSEGFKAKSLSLYLSSARMDFADFQPSGLFVATVVDVHFASFFCGAYFVDQIQPRLLELIDDFFHSSLDIRGRRRPVIYVSLEICCSIHQIRSNHWILRIFA